jgi:protein ImuB
MPKKRPRRNRFPQPSFILSKPLRLGMRGELPMYQGTLQMVAGPHRIEGGWWHRLKSAEGDGETSQTVVRDYWVAQSPHAGVLWVFSERLAGENTAWYLHGTFA